MEWASCPFLTVRTYSEFNSPTVAPVAWASCRGMGILPWHGHLAVAWASCPLQFPGGQDAHSTPIHSKTDATPELWLMAEPSEYNCVVII
ncbi:MULTISPECIES: hypothetical protein [Moorena]|uniref:hypothetical protein n=1 Tax=Moorena TaxID=1155738 RepID=UPI001056C6C8|nr:MULTISPECIES: hypothetical protein [Moorena]NEQ12675.1 hypothetical protein [Moorena sp. SIO3E2]NEP69998.1 hypothetical protein [Moorena sp. SIO3A5]NEQ09048.1 hypothetical protein [Moorena sp. SIO4E2]NER87732.1 hypothetical protein [Moorena sp. SIO3A2]NES43796.1 hypothetical protein [Moorena sp. SIO2C4]